MKNFAISTGLPGLDKILDHLRWGDNVVWQVDNIDNYKYFVEPFVHRVRSDKGRLVYMRFGQHPPIIPPYPDIKVYELDPEQGFESFSAQVHMIATNEGKEVFYVFDCLSDLQSSWATDLMIGNFFKVTCPYLFELDTIAYFTILRNFNSFQTIARIRETTQLLLDVYCQQEQFYVQPIKVWNRYSPTMFMPHIGINDQYVPITSSSETTRIFSYFQHFEPGDTERKLDYWDKVFIKAQKLAENKTGMDIADSDEETPMLEQLCRMLIGRDDRILALARRYFTLEDLIRIGRRLIGSGYIGGKAVGMLLARKILESDDQRLWSQWLEPHDSIYVGSDVFYTYLVENDCWNLRLQQKNENHYFSAAAQLKDRILKGKFPMGISERFYEILEYFGQSPIIVRSSSLLEDGFGNAFAGKYESIFCVNRGSPQERYDFFETAVKRIYASTMNEDALTYRLQRGLDKRDEQMALLVQRVSGSYYHRYFFPALAGVAMSYNPYAWREDLNRQAGMMRLVLGLGTRAVDRVEDDYPRLVALDKPALRPESNLADIRRYSQRKVDLLDAGQNEWRTEDLDTIHPYLSSAPFWQLIAMPDDERKTKMDNGPAWILSFDNLLAQTDFPDIMARMLKTLEAAYEYPVDTEFAANFAANGHIQINLLQCRPLQTYLDEDTELAIDNMAGKEVLFSARDSFMGGSILQPVGSIVYVAVEVYKELNQSDKYQVARLIGKLNRWYKNHPQPLMLIGPGRWGSSIPSLGIPISFAEICNASVLVETADEQAGYMPELSYGTHFFQDLVETRILYAALMVGRPEVTFNQKWLEAAPNRFADIMPDYTKWQSVIKVIDLPALNRTLWVGSDMKKRQLIAYFD